MPKWRRDSIFGTGPRRPLDREQRARFRALLHLHRRPGRLTLACVAVGRVLLDMLGADGRLDPSHATLAARAAVDVATVKRALVRLRELGFVAWARRLIRDAGTGWRAEQVTNAYALACPGPAAPRPPCEAHFARAVGFKRSKSIAELDADARQSAVRQLAALGFLPPAAWRACWATPRHRPTQPSNRNELGWPRDAQAPNVRLGKAIGPWRVPPGPQGGSRGPSRSSELGRGTSRPTAWIRTGGSASSRNTAANALACMWTRRARRISS